MELSSIDGVTRRTIGLEGLNKRKRMKETLSQGACAKMNQLDRIVIS